MSEGVQFEEWRPPQNYNDQGGSKMAAWLVRRGVARNSKQANIILFVASLIFLGIALFLFLT